MVEVKLVKIFFDVKEEEKILKPRIWFLWFLLALLSVILFWDLFSILVDLFVMVVVIGILEAKLMSFFVFSFTLKIVCSLIMIGGLVIILRLLGENYFFYYLWYFSVIFFEGWIKKIKDYLIIGLFFVVLMIIFLIGRYFYTRKELDKEIKNLDG